MLGEDYEQNGVDKKRDRVRLNTLGGRKMGELYGEREAEIGRSLKSKRVHESRDRESTEGSDYYYFIFFMFLLFLFFLI